MLECLSLAGIIITFVLTALYFRITIIAASCSAALSQDAIPDASSGISCRDVARLRRDSDRYITITLAAVNIFVIAILFSAIIRVFAKDLLEKLRGKQPEKEKRKSSSLIRIERPSLAWSTMPSFSNSSQRLLDGSTSRSIGDDTKKGDVETGYTLSPAFRRHPTLDGTLPGRAHDRHRGQQTTQANKAASFEPQPIKATLPVQSRSTAMLDESDGPPPRSAATRPGAPSIALTTFYSNPLLLSRGKSERVLVRGTEPGAASGSVAAVVATQGTLVLSGSSPFIAKAHDHLSAPFAPVNARLDN